MCHILIAIPDHATRKALTLLVSRKLPANSIKEAQDMESMIRTLVEGPPDLLLLDWNLYGSPAPETCRLLQRAYPQLKIIVLSLDSTHEPAVKAAGADFVHKGASPDELLSHVTKAVQEEARPLN